MNEMAVYKEVLAMKTWIDFNFHDVSSAMASIQKNLRNQRRFNRKLAILSAIFGGISYIYYKNITEQELSIHKLEKRLDELGQEHDRSLKDQHEHG